MLFFAKTLRASMTLWRRNDVRKFDASAILFKENLCKKMDILMFMRRFRCSLSPSYTVTIPVTIHHDLSRFEPDGKIGVHRDASGWKKRKPSINTVSHDDPMVSAQFIYGSTTNHDGSATIHRGGATNAQDASTIRYDSS